jgi:hypothetical protein
VLGNSGRRFDADDPAAPVMTEESATAKITGMAMT